jgi:hypothetical protein
MVKWIRLNWLGIGCNASTYIDGTNAWDLPVYTVYSLQYANIPKDFFTPEHLGLYCTNIMPGHCGCFLFIYSLFNDALSVTQTI